MYRFLVYGEVDSTHNMSQGKKFHIRVLADSRGRKLKNELHRLNDGTLYFSTRVRKGAKLCDLWELAESDILTGQTDLLILYGGICDITDIHIARSGRRSFWPPANLSTRFDNIKSNMDSIVRNYQLLNCNTKLCFIPEAGVGLAMLNRISPPIPEDVRALQSQLEEELSDLQNFTKALNDSLNILTPWTLKITHLRRENNWVPVYSRSDDGLHPSTAQAFRMAKVIKKHAQSVFGLRDIQSTVS